MIKVYLDWNVMSQMKQGNHAELAKALEDSNQFMLYFSTSHITDILTSYNVTEEQSKWIESDLNYISQLTGDLCAYNVNGEIYLNRYDPKELFEQQLDFKQLTGKGNLFDFVIDSAEPDPSIQNALNLFLNLPLPSEIAEALRNQSSREALQKIYPQLDEHSTMSDLVNAGWQQMKDLNETDKYNTLRSDLQANLGIKPNQLYESKDPYKEIERKYAKLEEQAGVHMNRHHKPTNYAPQWFQEITGEYLKLDMHGYQPDKVRIDKGRKQTMRNTIDDGFHAAFASMGDFYITNDTKSLKKTIEVFKKLNINTRVYSVEEFLRYYNDYLSYSDLSVHLQLWTEILKSKDYVVSKEEFGWSMTYSLNYFLFDYFNKAYVINWTDNPVPTIMLSKDKPTNNKTVSSVEVAALVNKLNAVFQTHSKSVDANDINFESWNNYEWHPGECTYTLTIVNGYLQLYLDASAYWSMKKDD